MPENLDNLFIEPFSEQELETFFGGAGDPNAVSSCNKGEGCCSCSSCSNCLDVPSMP